MTLLRKPYLLLFTLFASISFVPVVAAEVISVPQLVPFDDGANIRQAIKNECKLDTRLPAYVKKYLKKSGAFSDNRNEGKYLDMRITDVVAKGGGLYSGPKWMEVKGTLLTNGKPGPSFRAKRVTTQGARACSAAARCAKAIAKDIAKWLKNPVDNAALGDAR